MRSGIRAMHTSKYIYKKAMIFLIVKPSDMAINHHIGKTELFSDSNPSSTVKPIGRQVNTIGNNGIPTIGENIIGKEPLSCSD